MLVCVVLYREIQIHVQEIILAMTQRSHMQKKNDWVVSTFDSFMPMRSSGSTVCKRQPKKNDSSVVVESDVKSCSQTKYIEQKQQELWVDKHKPKIPEELAVHKKKIEDVRLWLQKALKSSNSNQMLLLTGPAGAGKTATVHCLAEEMKFEVDEWTNKSGTCFLNDGNVYCESQMLTFRNFLTRATKYSSGQIFGNDSTFGTKVILVEEFPTAILKDVTEFHSILRHYRIFGRSPLIFIVTDSVKDDKNERHLFPKDFQVEIAVTNIVFNPVAPTNLSRVLSRIAHAEGLDVSKSTIDSIVENSRGDIRAAVNVLQFTFNNDAQVKNSHHSMVKLPANKVRSKAKKKIEKLPSDDTPAVIFGSRDESLFLFHALGKVLHCKRETDKPVPHSLPPVIKEMERHSLLIKPEEIFHKTSVSANSFIAFLHQNYMQFFFDLGAIVTAARYLSEADCLNCEWMESTSLETYIFSIATRGLLHCNEGRTHVGWKPLHKPGVFSVMKKYRENTESGRCTFQEKCHHLSTEELFSQVIPYMHKIRPKLCADQQIFVNNIGKWPTHCSSAAALSRGQMEMLNEKDIAEDITEQQEREFCPLQMRTHSTTIEDPHEGLDEILIEEFSD